MRALFSLEILQARAAKGLMLGSVEGDPSRLPTVMTAKLLILERSGRGGERNERLRSFGRKRGREGDDVEHDIQNYIFLLLFFVLSPTPHPPDEDCPQRKAGQTPRKKPDCCAMLTTPCPSAVREKLCNVVHTEGGRVGGRKRRGVCV